MFKEQDVVAKRYRLLRELGRGGMGVVWEAEDLEGGGRVAFKAIVSKLARDPKKLDRFVTGTEAVSGLTSPHIVDLLEFGVEPTPYIVMELLEGTVLTERIASGHRFDLVEAVQIVVQTAKALTVAHDGGVVHRNLKPGNVFLLQGEETFVKVFDFGTAKSLTGFRNANDITTMGAILGNPDYLAPEQLSGDARSDHRADVWSLGAIAYHLVTGVTPFEGEQMGAIMRSILFSEPEPPTQVSSALPVAFDAFFAKALAKKRDERFQTAMDLAKALAAAANVPLNTTTPKSNPNPRPRVNPSPRPGVNPSPRPGVKEAAPTSGRSGEGSVPTAAPRVASTSAPRVKNDEAATGVVPLAETTSPLLRPTRASGLDLPSTPVLVLGAAVFLGIGGALAWMLMNPAANETPGQPSSESKPTVGTATPERPSARPRPTASAPASAAVTPGSASATVAADFSASASASTRVVPRRQWRDPNDIYEGLD